MYVRSVVEQFQRGVGVAQAVESEVATGGELRQANGERVAPSPSRFERQTNEPTLETVGFFLAQSIPFEWAIQASLWR